MLRVRFAPSPTGFLHIGSARTFIFNWLFARHHGGTTILRIDDTDVDRNTLQSEQSIFDGLRWLGLGWDEEYRQSERLDLHRQLAQIIFDKGFAYRDFTPARAEEEDDSRQGATWLFNPGMRELSREESDRRAAAGEPFVIRYRVPRDTRGEVAFRDAVYGPQSKATADIEDFALLRSNRLPTYHMASCADDVDLRISHIVRGQDHLTNTFKHVLIFEALGAEVPAFAHLPLLLAPDGAKLSKRKHGPVVSVTTYRDAGFVPQAFVNFLCLLGWSPKDDRERMTVADLVEAFSLEGINRSNAVVNFREDDPFDPKAVWLNAQHIMALPVEELADQLIPFLLAAGYKAPRDRVLKVTPLIRERIKTLRDAVSVADFFFADELPPYDAAELIPQKGDAKLALTVLVRACEVLNGAEFTHAALEAALRGAAESLHVKAGQMFQPIRVAVCGRKNAPPLFETLEVLGRDTCLERIGQAIEKLQRSQENRSTICDPHPAIDFEEAMRERDPNLTESKPEGDSTAGLPIVTPGRPSNFIREMIVRDLETDRFGGRVHTRFPPEPNGYLHIGHAKSICLNFGLAAEFGGKCNLRFDDTNPSKEETEYVESIMEDVRWLGFDWEDRLFYASDYFGQLYEWAIQLIKEGKAYVCDLTADEIREYRGTLTEPGRESPYRNRSVEENLDLFERMRAGEFPDGSRTLRAKIDMASPNLNLRDPVMYRILHAEHHRTGNEWCIYPMYDYTHGESDSIERITHSICTLEFEDHRPLYDWYVEQLRIYHPQQIEFARLNLTYTVLSKRKLLTLVQNGYVRGWDDPRMPTISGMRRRGYTPEAIRNFCDRIGVAKFNGIIELSLLEHFVREDLNKRAPRVMAVLRPLRVVIDNYPEDLVEQMDATNNPEDESAGKRSVPFSKVLYIEQDDFRENPPKEYFRLAPGREVRLRYGYFIKCTGVVKNEKGEVVELHCTYDPATRGGNAPDKRKVKSTIHWVSAAHAIDAEVRLYDTLFTKENPGEDEGKAFTDDLNPGSLEVLTGCKLEPSLAEPAPGSRYQFERLGYFSVDRDSAPGKPVFNRTVALRDTWAKIEKRAAAGGE